MTKDEALKLALEALKQIDEAMPFPVAKLAQAAIKEALAQPEQEPVACVVPHGATMRLEWASVDAAHNAKIGPLYTTPPQRKEPDPVVWMYQDKSTHEVRFQKHMRGFVDHGATYETPLYTTPPQRKPLTDEEIGAILEGVNAYGTRLYTFARAIEAAHGIKGEA